PIARIHGDLRQPAIAAGVGRPMDVAPFAVLIMADGDVVVIAVETEPCRPQRSVRRGRDGWPIVLPVLMAHSLAGNGDVLDADLLRGGRGIRRLPRGSTPDGGAGGRQRYQYDDLISHQVS